jgi:hypothetical protein
MHHLLEFGTTYVIGDNSQNNLDGLLFFWTAAKNYS